MKTYSYNELSAMRVTDPVDARLLHTARVFAAKYYAERARRKEAIEGKLVAQRRRRALVLELLEKSDERRATNDLP